MYNIVVSNTCGHCKELMSALYRSGHTINFHDVNSMLSNTNDPHIPLFVKDAVFSGQIKSVPTFVHSDGRLVTGKNNILQMFNIV